MGITSFMLRLYVYFHMALYVDLRSQLWQLYHTPSWKTNLYCLTCSGVLYSFPQTSHLNVILWLFYYVKSPHPDSYQTYSKLFYINTIFKFTYCFTLYFTIFQFIFLRLRQIFKFYTLSSYNYGQYFICILFKTVSCLFKNQKP